MAAYDILAYLLLGALLGALGQGIRVIVGLKKKADENLAQPLRTWFDPQRLLLSLLIGALAGCLSVVLLIGSELDRNSLLTIIASGYAGTDFIEGFIKGKQPKAQE